MESQSFENRGEGVPPSSVPQKQKCKYAGPGGRRCRMLADFGSELCPFHQRLVVAEEPIINEATANALLAGVDKFEDSGEVKLFLSNVVKQVIHQRVGRRDAVTLAYLSQLILNCEAITLRELRDEDLREAAKPKPPEKLEIIWDLPGPKRDAEPQKPDDGKKGKSGN